MPRDPDGAPAQGHRRALGAVHPARHTGAHLIRQRPGVRGQVGPVPGSRPSAPAQPILPRGSPGENGYIEPFNAPPRDQLLDGEIFYSLREAEIIIESWRRYNNTLRPHAFLGYRPPAREVFLPAFAV